MSQRAEEACSGGEEKEEALLAQEKPMQELGESVKLHCHLYPRQTVRKRVMEKRGEDFKKEGKIYRLRTQDDGEDENNTWNGNSTQQM